MLPLGFRSVSHQTSVVVPSLDCAWQTNTKGLNYSTNHMGIRCTRHRSEFWALQCSCNSVLSLLLDRNNQLSLVQRHYVMQLASTDCVEPCHSGSAVSRLTRRSLSAIQDGGIHLYHTLVILWTHKRVLSCCLSAEEAMTAPAVCKLYACDALRSVYCKRPGQICQAADMQKEWWCQ